MAVQTHDDGFHEIQLNGKQLVFLFMAATVVSVVIFLCGVLVGRGVRAERGGDAAAIAAAPDVPTPQAAAPASATPAGADPRQAAAPPPTADDLTYFNRLEKSAPAAEDLKAPKADNAPPPRVEAAPAKPAAAEKAAAQEKAANASSGNLANPANPGYAVQVAALNVRGEADAIAKRLASKGYAAYVMTPASGTPQVYRVRIGTFPTRREAEAIAAKLQKEEQFKPWITR